MRKIKLQKIVLDKLRKSVHEWSGPLEIFILPQAIETSRQFLFLRTCILQKTVVQCPRWLSAIFPLTPFLNTVFIRLNAVLE